MAKLGRIHPEDQFQRCDSQGDDWLPAWKANELFPEEVRRRYAAGGTAPAPTEPRPTSFDIECVDPASGTSVVKRFLAADAEGVTSQAQRLGFLVGRVRPVEAAHAGTTEPAPVERPTPVGTVRRAMHRFAGQSVSPDFQAIAGILALVGLFGIIHGGSMLIGSADFTSLLRGTVLEHDAGTKQVAQNSRETGWVYLAGGVGAMVIGAGIATASGARKRSRVGSSSASSPPIAGAGASDAIGGNNFGE